MKIAVATAGNGGLKDVVSATFGRCPTFTIVDTAGEEIVGSMVVENEYQSQPSAAGIKTAQNLISIGVEAVIAGNFGINAREVLGQAGIAIVQAMDMTAEDAVQKFIRSEIGPSTGGGVKPSVPLGRGGGMGMGRGMGPGIGRGMGMGRGMGRGMGPGMGMGRGFAGHGVIPLETERFQCPQCGCTMPRKPGVESMKCPNCGADMV